MARQALSTSDDSSATAVVSFGIHHSGFVISSVWVQRRVKCIDDENGNGFVWHTTGKTPTSFKASTLATLRDTLLSGKVSIPLSP